MSGSTERRDKEKRMEKTSWCVEASVLVAYNAMIFADLHDGGIPSAFSLPL
jgi:hypothetical protein